MLRYAKSKGVRSGDLRSGQTEEGAAMRKKTASTGVTEEIEQLEESAVENKKKKREVK